MKTLIFFIISLTGIFLFLKQTFKFKRKKRFFNNKENRSFNKSNINNWMNLTRKERYNLSKKESISYLRKRKVLLEEIRKEYKIISKANAEEK